jgi:hypothetical protein
MFVAALFIATRSPAQVTLIRAAHLLDPRTGNLLSPAAVLVEKNKITQVESRMDAPANATVIDLGGADLSELERVRFVMKDGQVIRNETIRRIEAEALLVPAITRAPSHLHLRDDRRGTKLFKTTHQPESTLRPLRMGHIRNRPRGSSR